MEGAELVYLEVSVCFIQMLNKISNLTIYFRGKDPGFGSEQDPALM